MHYGTYHPTKFDEFRKTNSNNVSSYSAPTAYKTGARWRRNGVNVPTGCKFFSKTAKRRNSSNRFQFPERWRSWLSPTLVYNQTKDAVLNSCLFRVLQGNRTDSEKLCLLTEWLVVDSRARHSLYTCSTQQSQRQRLKLRNKFVEQFRTISNLFVFATQFLSQVC